MFSARPYISSCLCVWDRADIFGRDILVLVFLDVPTVHLRHFDVDFPYLQFLFQTLSEMTTTEQRAFLCFATGSPRLPIGGKCSPSRSHGQWGRTTWEGSPSVIRRAFVCWLWHSNACCFLSFAGLAMLTPPLTIVRRGSDGDGDDPDFFLPTVRQHSRDSACHSFASRLMCCARAGDDVCELHKAAQVHIRSCAQDAAFEGTQQPSSTHAHVQLPD